jgi:hypothetical protein
MDIISVCFCVFTSVTQNKTEHFVRSSTTEKHIYAPSEKVRFLLGLETEKKSRFTRPAKALGLFW